VKAGKERALYNNQSNGRSDAMRYFEKARELRPNNPALLEALGRAWMPMNQPEKAVALFEQSVKLDETRPEAWTNWFAPLLAQPVGQFFYNPLHSIKNFDLANWSSFSGTQARCLGSWGTARKENLCTSANLLLCVSNGLRGPPRGLANRMLRTIDFHPLEKACFVRQREPLPVHSNPFFEDSPYTPSQNRRYTIGSRKVPILLTRESVVETLSPSRVLPK
jgi:hypothetical protein